MVTTDNDDDDDDNDDDAPPDYEMTAARTSGSTLASDVRVCTAGENSSLFTWPFVGNVPVPPAYQRYTMATDITGLYSTHNYM